MTPEELREQQKAEVKAVRARQMRERKAMAALAAMPDDERRAFIVWIAREIDIHVPASEEL